MKFEQIQNLEENDKPSTFKNKNLLLPEISEDQKIVDNGDSGFPKKKAAITNRPR